MTKIEPVAAYVRVSTQEQKLHGLSLDAQRMKLADYAEKNNMKIVEWYEDEGVSGRKLIKNRPELQRMIQDAEKKKFQRILFIKLDRFFRSVAEYHECMKRISPVVWTTTEEQYDLTTANGRMLVNMKLTIAELEADQTGERIKIVNEYKVQTGQPLVSDRCLPYGFKVYKGEGKKCVIRDPEKEQAVRDVIDFYIKHQSLKKALIFINTTYGANLMYKALKALLSNTMLCGEYRGNPNYCEGYIDRETFDLIQKILKRNVKENTSQDRHYLFSGLLVCPECGSRLRGTISSEEINGTRYRYKRYTCPQHKLNHRCSYNKSISENAFERLMLAEVEQYLGKMYAETCDISEKKSAVAPKYNVEDIYAQIDRLNYSWQTGKIRTAEKYEADYAELVRKLELATEAQPKQTPKDYSKLEATFKAGWQTMYQSLDDEHKRTFWRSFISFIEVDWNKKISNISFF